MKKNDYLLLAATGAYSFLFYQQNSGINFLLFTTILLAIILIRNTALIRNKKWLWCATLCMISAVSVFINSSALSVIANIICLLLLSGVSFNTTTSGLFSFMFSYFSVVSAVVYMVIDTLKRLQPKADSSPGKKGNKVLVTGLVLLMSIMFFNMYKSSNPLFAENTRWINFDFISFSWICFTISGVLLMYAFLYHRTINPIEKWENSLPLTNIPAEESEPKQKQFETERYAGLLLFVLLNMMLVILNIGDIQTLYFNGGLPKNITHADFVHSGVGVIILSILIASGMIMYLFRKEFSTVKNNETLMAFVYLWIAQNVLMLSSTALRNQIYIHEFSLTYKRIGVYVWLTLAVVGLVIMFLKLKQERSNWYLIKTNVAVWFSVLTLSACFNWDKIITNYNLHNKPLNQIDFSYLLSLSEANIPELITISESKDFKVLYEKQTRIRMAYQAEQKNLNSLNNYSTPRMRELEEQIKVNHSLFSGDRNYYDRLTTKIKEYVDSYTNDWRSFDLRDKEITKSIYK